MSWTASIFEGYYLSIAEKEDPPLWLSLQVVIAVTWAGRLGLIYCSGWFGGSKGLQLSGLAYALYVKMHKLTYTHWWVSHESCGKGRVWAPLIHGIKSCYKPSGCYNSILQTIGAIDSPFSGCIVNFSAYFILEDVDWISREEFIRLLWSTHFSCIIRRWGLDTSHRDIVRLL